MRFLGRRSWAGVWGGACLVLGLAAGCAKTATPGDSETHFLAKCTDTCGGGLSCVCGVCTKPCTASSSCGALSDAASCDDSCSDAATKICDVSCTVDDDCSSLGAKFGCDGGHCRQGASSTPSGGASGVGDGGAGNGSPAAGAGSGSIAECKARADSTPTLPDPTSLDADLVARAAAVIGSCIPDDGVDRNAAHIWLEHLAAPRLYFRFGEQLDCFADANCGCSALQQCIGWVYSAPPVPPETCPAGCDGDVFTGCGDGVKATMNCSRFGLACEPNAGCSPGAATACDGSAPPTCTANGEVESCDRGFVEHTPCASLGFTCTGGECVGEGGACTANSSGENEAIAPAGTGCSGNTLQACLGGHTTSVNCAEQGPGFTCQSLGTAFFCGLAAECTPADNYSTSDTTPPACDGNVLTFCNAGRLEHLDCTTLGFTGCEIDRKVGHYGCTPGTVLQ